MSKLSNRDLPAVRREMDAIDQELVTLLNRRAAVSLRVAALKQGNSGAVFVPEREAEVFTNIRRTNLGGALPDAHLEAIYREILSSSRALQVPPRIAYLGPPATFSNQAAEAFFGASARFESKDSFVDIFAAVTSEQASFGVVPVENSIEGPVQQNLDLLADSEAQVCGEVTIPVAHFLMARPGTRLEEVRRVFAHPQAEGQCRRWLASRLAGREVVNVSSNITAAEMAVSQPESAAVSPRQAAEIYQLEILAENIQDSNSNFTRFFVIGRQASQAATGRDRTALCFSIRDRVGALRDVVSVFADARLNLSAIQSRPSRRRAWEYLFFLEVEGHPADERVSAALRAVEQHCVFLKVLGAWPMPAAADS